ncbi:MAG: chromosome partitioning protein, ParB family [bacterium P3]|nr:MAG: chromosome partitioning protein, ParB family [bacterium P3]KWW42180.1 MAG: chromosome partitioning protein, ParB family [bacterium F083]
MPTKKNPLKGRGLSAILGEAIDIDTMQGNANVTAAISLLPIDKIIVNPFQPRKDFNQEALEELAQSIRRQGVITPVTVRKMPDGTYQLIAGERRFRASQLAGLTEIPGYVRIATDSQMMEMALVENIQRENLNAMEVAFSYNALIEECQLTHEQLSERLGKSRATITNYLRLLNLPAETQLALSTDQISMAHARALLSVEEAETHLNLLHEVISQQLSVHQLEQRIKALHAETAPRGTRKPDPLPLSHRQGCDTLRQYLQSEVDVRRSRRGKGTITIQFNTDSDFARILSLIQNKK